MCWMPWKKRYDSTNTYYFPAIKIHSAVDKCTYNFIEYGDVSYELPSAPIREVLKITNTDGYLFFDCDQQIKAVSISVGEKWRTQQNYLLVDKSILRDLEQSGHTLLWIMREDRRESGKAKERFGDFYAEKDRSYVGFFRNGELIVIPFSSSEILNANVDEEDDPLCEILDYRGHGTENPNHTEQVAIQGDEESGKDIL